VIINDHLKPAADFLEHDNGLELLRIAPGSKGPFPFHRIPVAFQFILGERLVIRRFQQLPQDVRATLRFQFVAGKLAHAEKRAGQPQCLQHGRTLMQGEGRVLRQNRRAGVLAPDAGQTRIAEHSGLVRGQRLALG
jgi:hypothetical protein